MHLQIGATYFATTATLLSTFLSVLCAMALVGCNSQEGPQAVATDQGAQADARIDTAGLNAASASTTQPEAEHSQSPPHDEASDRQDKSAAVNHPGELWDVSYINGQKVGHTHTTFATVHKNGRELIKIDQQGQISVSRFGTPVTISMNFTSLETLTGELASFDCTVAIGPLPNSSSGVVRDRLLKTTTSTLGKKTTKNLAWDPAWGGFFAVEQSLRNKPLQPGETRSFKSLMPQATNVAIAEVTLKAADYEMTDLLNGKRELLKFEVSMKAGGPHDTEQTMWSDRRGEVLKAFTKELGGMATYRASREIALRKSDTGSFDLGKFSTVEVGAFENAHGTQQVDYVVRLKNDNPADVFAHCGSQQVKSIDEHSAKVRVVAVRATTPEKLAVEPDEPNGDDLAANNLIQSDDQQVIAMAANVSPGEKNMWALATALELEVYRKMRSKNFSTAFATAAEVARSLEGDCTEHAVLLAALCRARKIPARVAVGLVYYRPQRGFAFHMWNEVWVNSRWVPLDATLGHGGIGAAHLKLADSSLANSDSFSALLPAAKVMGQLEVEVVKMK